MKREPEEIIEVDDNWRYAKYVDYSGFDYLTEWDHDGWGMFTISQAERLRGLELDTFRINDRLRAVMEWHGHSWNDKRAETELGKAISRAGYAYKFVDLQGYSQGQWHYVVIYWDTNNLTSPDGVLGELEAWYCGEVYTVALENKVTYSEVGGDREIVEWDAVESIGCVLFYDDYPFNAENCAELIGAYQLVAA